MLFQTRLKTSQHLRVYDSSRSLKTFSLSYIQLNGIAYLINNRHLHRHDTLKLLNQWDHPARTVVPSSPVSSHLNDTNECSIHRNVTYPDAPGTPRLNFGRWIMQALLRKVMWIHDGASRQGSPSTWTGIALAVLRIADRHCVTRTPPWPPICKPACWCQKFIFTIYKQQPICIDNLTKHFPQSKHNIQLLKIIYNLFFVRR